jgi:hypothetical protein
MSSVTSCVAVGGGVRERIYDFDGSVTFGKSNSIRVIIIMLPIKP